MHVSLRSASRPNVYGLAGEITTAPHLVLKMTIDAAPLFWQYEVKGKRLHFLRL
jgi:hypothetical protein